MAANSPEEICRLFRQYMAEGDIDAVLSLYDAEAAFLNESGEVRRGEEGLRRELAPLAAARPAVEFKIKRVVRSGDIALMHTLWRLPGRDPEDAGISTYAIEVARRQPDGTWRWLIGDPFTVGRPASF